MENAMQALEFKMSSDEKFREATITLENGNDYLKLFDLFFRPDVMLGKDFDKIFSGEGEGYHSMMSKSEKDFRSWNGWIFRGQKGENGHLVPDFERRFFEIFNNPETIPSRDLFDIEMGIIRDFKRTAGSFYPELKFINDRDIYEYIAWIRHFNGATRVIDMTNSFFIALFFALGKTLPKEDGVYYIWCIDKVWLEHRYKEFMPLEIRKMYKEYDDFGKDVRIQDAILNYVPNLEKAFEKDKKNGKNEKDERYRHEFCSVINIEPFYKNSRLVRQKSLFLMPTNPYRTFEENLFNMVINKKDTYHILRIKVECDRKSAVLIQKVLDGMNINGSVLFETLEGICETLSTRPLFQNDSITVSPQAGINNATSSFMFGDMPKIKEEIK